ncbi:MAG: NAD(P)-binding domain-containing protein [Actinomycetota bacterium]
MTHHSAAAQVTTVIIGGGQAGLAMSRALQMASIDHVVLERGQVANSWRTERWDSLRLLTPNWMTRLPGHRYDGGDPEGYMTAAETAAFLDHYRAVIAAPVVTGATVSAVEIDEPGRYRVRTTVGDWRCRSVVVATGACTTPHVPALAGRLPGRIQQLTPTAYRNPDTVDGERVLVVGASAGGAQIADELARAGRDVTLAAGNHVRVPRTYRGMDIHWWMDRLGLLDERWTEVDDIVRARRTPSLQVVGHPDRRPLDLNTLQANGATVVGRLAGVTDTAVQFSGSLANTVTSADLKLGRLLDAIDDHVDATGLGAEVAAPDRPAATVVAEAPLLRSPADIDAVLWATGYRPHYTWLPEQLLDRKGAIVHEGGVMAAPGMYVLGLPFLRRRKSSFLDGVGPDALDLADHLVGWLDGRGHASSRPAPGGPGIRRSDPVGVAL